MYNNLMDKQHKTIFLDIDGTLVGDKGTVPDSAKEAILKVKGNGHKVIICTGRTLDEIYPPIMEIGFDGIIACGGNYVIANDEILYERYFSLEDLKHLYEYFEKYGINFYAEAISGIYASKGCDQQLYDLAMEIAKDKGEHFMEHFNVFRNVMKQNENLLRDDVTKISFLGSNHPIDDLKEAYKDKFEIFDLVVPMFGANSGEISIKGTDKTVGMDIMIHHFDLIEENSIAIGDGNNDITMLQKAAIGVCMGNGTEKLKAVADMITDDVNHDGLAKALNELKLT